MLKFFIAAGVIVSFLVITSVPSIANDLIYGCVDKKGKLKIVDGPGACKKKETPILWNVQKDRKVIKVLKDNQVTLDRRGRLGGSWSSGYRWPRWS